MRSVFITSLLFLPYLFAVPAKAWATTGNSENGNAVPDELTLEAALDSVFQKNSGLFADSLEIEVRFAKKLQARLPDNPEISVEAEDIGFSNNRFNRGTRFTMELEQTFKPAARIAGSRVANAGIGVAEKKFKARRVDLAAEVKSRFSYCLALQDLLALSDTLLGIVQKAHEISVLQAQAGKTPISDTLIASAEYSLALMRRERGRLNMTNAYRELYSLWGGENQAFRCVGIPLDSVKAVPESSVLLAQFESTPLVRLHDAEVAESHAELGYEKSLRIPSITVGAGMESTTGSGDPAPRASLSFSVRFLNWNQGAIRAAEYEKRKSEMIRNDAMTQLRKNLINTVQTADRLYKETVLLKTTVLPRYRKGFDASMLSYTSGKSDIQILMSAQKSFFEFSREYLETALEYRETMIELERISGLDILK